MKNPLPAVEEIEALHRKYAPSDAVFKDVWTHCLIVCDIAMQLAQNSKLELDLDLVRAGCLLHDIGVHSYYADKQAGNEPHYITHGIRGEDILKSEGFSETVYRFASHHTGAGLSKEQIIEKQLPLPHQDFMAETPEEELVMYADKFHSKTEPPRFNRHESYSKYVAEFGEGPAASFAALTAKFGKPDLEPLAARYGQALR